MSIMYLALLLSVSVATAGEIVYFQSVKGSMKESSQLNSKTIIELKRGDALNVLDKQGIWINVEFKENKGWVSRLFTSSHPPIGAASLSQEVHTSPERTTRRRPSSYSVAATARGLILDERGRHGREIFRSDYDSLKALEDYQISENELDKFKNSGRLE